MNLFDISHEVSTPISSSVSFDWGLQQVNHRDPVVVAPLYMVEVASTREDILAAQQLRFEVFRAEYGASFSSAIAGIDQDEFDQFCDHLIVRERCSHRVVGTYRMLLPNQAKRLGRYYSQGEFFMTRIERMIQGLLEIGRSCVHPDHRNGAVIMMLWSGIVRYLLDNRCTHLIGCASVSMRDGGVRAATLWDRFQGNLMVDPMLEAFPKHPLPLETLPRDTDRMVPPLIRAYLKIGARVYGEPNWDPDFNTADFLMLLDITELDRRYARHFGIGPT